MIRILTDSACDILPAEAQQLGVTVIPLNVTLEELDRFDAELKARKEAEAQRLAAEKAKLAD